MSDATTIWPGSFSGSRAIGNAASEEAMLTASTYCLLPVVKVNGLVLGDGRPGPVVTGLVRAWSELVGMDVVGQAMTRVGQES